MRVAPVFEFFVGFIAGFSLLIMGLIILLLGLGAKIVIIHPAIIPVQFKMWPFIMTFASILGLFVIIHLQYRTLIGKKK